VTESSAERALLRITVTRTIERDVTRLVAREAGARLSAAAGVVSTVAVATLLMAACATTERSATAVASSSTAATVLLLLRVASTDVTGLSRVVARNIFVSRTPGTGMLLELQTLLVIDEMCHDRIERERGISQTE
jgi:hypothetical protein